MGPPGLVLLDDNEVKGKIKETAGKVTNNPDLEAEGKAEHTTGKVEKKLGQIEKVFERGMRSDSPFDESRTVPSSTWDARHPVSKPSPHSGGSVRWYPPPDPLIGPICFSHFFDSWKQHRSGEGG